MKEISVSLWEVSKKDILQNKDKLKHQQILIYEPGRRTYGLYYVHKTTDLEELFDIFHPLESVYFLFDKLE